MVALMHARALLARSVAALVLVAAAASCRVNDATAPIGPCTERPSSIVIQFRDAQPTMFTWSPDCTVAGFVLEADSAVAGGGGDLWIIHDPKSRISAPLSYGVKPANATEVLAPTPLVTGRKYRLYLIDAQGHELYSASFTQ